jgi:signal transduction histidine kinase
LIFLKPPVLIKLSRLTALFFLLLLSYSSEGSDTSRLRVLFDFIDKNRHDSARVFDSSYTLLQLTGKDPMSGPEYPKALNSKGILFYYYGYYDSALTYFSTARKLFEEMKDTFHIARTSRLEGVMLESKSLFEEASAKFMEAQALYEKIKNEAGLAEAYLSIAIVFQRRIMYDEALEYYKKALHLALKNNQNRIIGVLNSNIGSLYSSLSEFDSSYKYLRAGLLWAEKQGDERGVYSAYHNIGTLHFHKKEYRKALEYYKKVIRESTDRDITATYVVLGETYLNLDELDSAEHYIRKGLESEKIYPSLAKRSEAHERLSEVEQKRGNYRLALEYFRIHKMLYDSISDLTFTDKLAETQARFNSRETQSENEKLKEIEKSQAVLIDIKAKNNLYLSILVFVLLCLIVLLFINMAKMKEKRAELDRLNAELKKKHLNLEAVMEEKNDLVGALAHDLRAPFSKIIGLSALIHDGRPEEKEEYLAMIESLGKDGLSLIQDLIDLSRIISLAGDNRTLDENPETFPVKGFLEKVIKSFGKQAAVKRIRIQLDCNENLAAHSKQNYLERICDNIISNALKYSPPGSSVYISGKLEEKNIKIHIKDEGPGFSEDDLKKMYRKFQRLSAKPTGPESSTGLGLFIARKLAQALGGDIHLLSLPGQSAHFCIVLPAA